MDVCNLALGGGAGPWENHRLKKREGDHPTGRPGEVVIRKAKSIITKQTQFFFFCLEEGKVAGFWMQKKNSGQLTRQIYFGQEGSEGIQP